MAFELPPLTYGYDALEPFIDAQTMQIHHDKHHAAYVANLNRASAQLPVSLPPDFKFSMTMTDGEELALSNFLRNAKLLADNPTIRNNGGGHYNHSLFWKMMKKSGGGEPTGELSTAVDTAFGSYAAFKDNFTKAALGQFGSGWAWLVLDKGAANLELKIESTPNQDSPVSQPASVLDGPLKFKIPLLGLDVWEHAYYLKYQNKRADYITAWFNVVNWDFV